MKIRLINLLLLTFLAMNCFSQNTRTSIYGKLFSINHSIDNVHIINLNTNQGTISTNINEFQIKVAVNDTLLFSSIQYKTLKIVLTEEQIKSNKIKIYLKPSVTILNEVFLHGLSGELSSDLKKTPIDTLPKHNFTFKQSDLNTILPPDTHGFLEAPNAQNLTDPILMNGVGGSAGIPDFYMIKLRKLKADLKAKKDFPDKIKSRLGIDFFVNTLNIPKEKINHFLGYCEFKNIIEEYKKNNLLEVIKILRNESKSYNKIKQ